MGSYLIAKVYLEVHQKKSDKRFKMVLKASP